MHLARSLMVLGRAAEAIAILQPALRGGVDGGNTYVTHTEVHEALAQAFELAGEAECPSPLPGGGSGVAARGPAVL